MPESQFADPGVRPAKGPRLIRHRIQVVDGPSFPCPHGERLLVAMERAGGSGLPVGCRRGGCGVCRIRILEGTYDLAPQSRVHVSAEDAALGYALSCCTHPTSDLVVMPSPSATLRKRARAEARSGPADPAPDPKPE